MSASEPSTQVSFEALSATAAGTAAEKDGSAPEPGLLLVFAAGQPACAVLPLSAAATEIGRGRGALADVQDPTLSRQHARIAYAAGEFVITDLGSRNGSALSGVVLHGSATARAGSVLRLGHSLFLLCADLRPYRRFGVTRQGQRVEGPALRHAMLAITQAAQVSRNLFIMGESGTGKELLAHSFHRAGPQHAGPFVPVNCAILGDGGAEPLLFGAVGGAYLGAQTATAGFLQAAHGGTLFLDEVADLPLAVQGKLLRVLENSAVTPLGATLPQPLKLHVCCATHRNLRQLVGEGRFRADLFFRIGVPQLVVPPLRQRLDEIPWHIAGALLRTGAALAVHSTLVEACLLRPWPGNVRELLAEVNTAVIAALAAGDSALLARHLSATAGMALEAVAAAAEAVAAADPAADEYELSEPDGDGDGDGDGDADPDADAADPLAERAPTRTTVLAAVEATHGNVSAAARVLGMHRTQLRRRLHQYGWVAKKLG